MRKKNSIKNYTVKRIKFVQQVNLKISFLQNDKIPKLSEEDKQLCDARITMKECSAALLEKQ